MGSLTQRLARSSAHRPWLVVGLWITTIAVAGLLSAQLLEDALTTEIDFTNDPEAKRAAELIEERFGETGETEVFILSSADLTITDPSSSEKCDRCKRRHRTWGSMPPPSTRPRITRWSRTTVTRP